MDRILVEVMQATPVGRQLFEMSERKGLGHPDTMCDLLAEEISRSLCRHYLSVCGRVLHHNIENAFLVAGHSRPAFGGGRIIAPMRFVYGDSATTELDGQSIPVAELTEAAIKSWFRANFPFIDPDRHIVLQNELHAGSAQLAGLFDSQRPGANDTCVGSGYAPLSEAETIVIETERYLNSPGFKQRYPETGQDIKVTGVRRARCLDLSISLAFVDSRVPDEAFYFDRKKEIEHDLEQHVSAFLRELDEIRIWTNTVDRPGMGTDGVYLTVLGTSADGADGGEVGRGNRACGLNSFQRPLATGAVAGKNPASNTGKIYNLFALEVAHKIHREVDGIEEAYVSLVSQIGQPLDSPMLAAVRLVPRHGADIPEIEMKSRNIVQREIELIYDFTESLVLHPRAVC